MQVAVRSLTFMSPIFERAARLAIADASLSEANLDQVTEDVVLKHRAHIVSSVVNSVAFVEAAVNEFIACCEQYPSGNYGQSISDESRDTIVYLWRIESSSLERMRVTDKMNTVLMLAGFGRLSEEGPVVNAKAVIRLRNDLIHYKPVWVEHGRVHKLEGRLQSQNLKPNPLVPDENPYWPDRVLSAALGAWALDSMTTLADAFFDRLGVEPNYRRLRLRDIPRGRS